MKTWPNLILILRNWQRNKIFTVVSILSLVIGLTCVNLLIAFIASEWQISKGSPDKNRIFMLKSDNPMDNQGKEKTSFILPKLPPLMKERYPEVETYCRFQGQQPNTIFETEEFRSDKILTLHADSNIGELFSIPLKAGNLKKTLSAPGEAALTASTSELIFGDSEVIGKVFSLNNEKGKNLYKITSVIDDSKASTFLKFNVLLAIDQNTYFGGVTFIKLDKEESATTILGKMKADGATLPRMSKTCQYYLQPLENVYFDTTETQTNWEFLMHRDKLLLFIGISAAIAILIISAFNYINMYMVRIFKNDKNTGIQKIMGADRKHLQIQLITETSLAVIVAFVFSFILAVLFIPVFNSLFDAHLTLYFAFDRTVLVGYLFLIILLILIPTLYLLFRIDKGPLTQMNQMGTPRFKAKMANGIVALQFIISIVLIIGAMFYSKQMNFISQTADIDRNIIEVKGYDLPPQKLRTFKDEVIRMNYASSVCISSSNFLNAWIHQGKEMIPVLYYHFDSDFLKTHNFKLVKGIGFSSEEKSSNMQVIVNEAFVKKFMNGDPIGQTLPVFNKKLAIKGVIADFYTESFVKEVKPTIILPFDFQKSSGIPVLHIQLAGKGLAPAIAEIKTKWDQHFPDNVFSYTFISDEFNKLHKTYTQSSQIISFFTLISILLNSFGLFGMTWYTVERRIKEIGIRKVNGARIMEVVGTLNQDIVKWVAIAFVIATPVAYYTMHKWLENFAYKTELSWWIFALAGLLALGIALLTVSWQSWKAASRNPVEALRYE